MTPNPDPRVEAIVRKLNFPREMGSWEEIQRRYPRMVWQTKEILAVIDALPRPAPGEIVVTEGLVEIGRMAYADWCKAHNKHNPWPYPEGIEAALDAVVAALDPRHRAVEPVAGDAVEAALKAYNWISPKASLKRPDGAEEMMSRAISAADRDRGRSYVTWRRPEEWVPIIVDDATKAAWVLWDTGAQTLWHGTSEPFHSRIVAWSEKPTPPPWATADGTAASGEPEAMRQFTARGERIVRKASDAAPLSEGETPWPQALRCADCAAAMVAGASDIPDAILWRCPECHYEVTDLRPGSHTDRSLREVALDVLARRTRAVAGHPQPPLTDAPEAPGVAWTAEKAALLKRLGEIVCGHSRRNDVWAELSQLNARAFPTAAPAWPPYGCLTKTNCIIRNECLHMNGKGHVCPHDGRGETGNE